MHKLQRIKNRSPGQEAPARLCIRLCAPSICRLGPAIMRLCQTAHQATQRSERDESPPGRDPGRPKQSKFSHGVARLWPPLLPAWAALRPWTLAEGRGHLRAPGSRPPKVHAPAGRR
ncbi:hypothetical protein P7K49_027934 [Saguinus oedipus]|uniref:Uncharacterized protein n=1 Tax=Saguinus oedipus TaxID=9490 RepID=A0ABQ9UAW4_SAGOE|nr:hypothetical protein P7K49_027934 [Saguinus oedipus]